MEQNAGEIIEHVIRRQNVNISELSRRLQVNRRTLYNWFSQKKLSIDIIVEIGKVINYDFSRDFGGKPLSFNPSAQASDYTENSTQEDQNLVHYWMEKYINLLEEYKKLVQRLN